MNFRHIAEIMPCCFKMFHYRRNTDVILKRLSAAITYSSSASRFQPSSTLLTFTLNQNSSSGIHNNHLKTTLLKRSTFPINPSPTTISSHFYHTSSIAQGLDKHTATSGSSSGRNSIDSLIETWFYEVSPHGSLKADLPFKTVIKSLPPQEYPDMNKVIIQMHFDSSDTEIPNGEQLSQIGDLYDLDVDFDEDKANMNVSCNVTKGVTLPLLCTFQVPLQFGLNLTVHDKDVSLDRLESSVIVIEAEKGNCFLNNIKCGSITAVNRSGNITSKSTLLGNIYFHTGMSGNIVADKLQGSTINIETEMGSVSVKSLYTENSTFRSDAGNISLGNCHGQLYMQAEKSDFKIESLEGDLDIGLQTGSVDAHLSRHNKASIEVKTGDISLSFPEDVDTDLNLDCPSIVVDKNMDIHFEETAQPHHREGYTGNKGKALVNVRTLSGTVNLKLLSWIQTTKLNFKLDDDM